MDNFNLSSKNYNKASNYDVPMLFFSIHYSLPHSGGLWRGRNGIHIGFTWGSKRRKRMKIDESCKVLKIKCVKGVGDGFEPQKPFKGSQKTAQKPHKNILCFHKKIVTLRS